MDAYPKSNLKIAVVVTFILLFGLALIPSDPANEPTRSEPVSLSIKAPTAPPPATMEDEAQAPVESPVVAAAAINTAAPTWRELKVRSGDSVARLFKRAGLTPQELHSVVTSGEPAKSLSKIMPGKTLWLATDDSGELVSLRYDASPLRKLVVDRSVTGNFDARWEDIEPEVLISWTTATISPEAPSLYHAGKAAGLSDNIIMELSYIFQWDISFALDLRQGDSFTLMYEDYIVDGEKVKEGNIIAAQFSNMGKNHQAVLYEDANGKSNYFAPDGRSLRKAFLRDPVHFSHISSSFNPNRMHPIHKRVMPHRGIDYAANRGTPVRASGDGNVTIARRNNASGNYVVIQHGEKYTTKYLHLSAFGKGIRPGRSVRQGDVIGYVGATGWATAPHLHYEFLVNGVHRNPRTVSLPKAEPIPQSELARFTAQTRPHLARLESILGNTGFAMATPATRTGGDD